ncbi:hypothetical protein ACFQPA_19840 [Halomarina halobia]|uniref:SCP2 domain-containing protein n=1 Tax=Halomarina halobia TaxID=3033386 RepID=A0ABD6AFW6_9EURY|nr:hypothetical protein [Halomarina sp. PSR21]
MSTFPSLEWFREFTEVLEDDPEFRQSMRHFDGSIRLEVGDQTIWMKIYRGRVIEVLDQEAEFGTTFTISGPSEEWERLLTADHNPFGEQQTLGKLVFSGNVLESTRLIDGINALVDCLRLQAGSDIVIASGGGE